MNTSATFFAMCFTPFAEYAFFVSQTSSLRETTNAAGTEPSLPVLFLVLIFRRHSRTAVITVRCEFGAAATEKKWLGLKVEVGCLRTTCELSNLGPGDLLSGGWPSVEYLWREFSSGN